MTATPDRYWEAVSAGRRDEAIAVARAAVAGGLSVEQVLRQYVAHCQRRVGELWQTNEWSVAREHGATAIGEAVVRSLAAQTPVPRGPRLLVACVEREWHSLPAMILTESLRSRGVDARFLGAHVTREGLLGHLLDLGPRAALISASLSSSLLACRRMIEAVRGTSTPVIAGGSAFGSDRELAQYLGATAHGTTPQDVIDALETLPKHVSPAGPLTHRAADEAGVVGGRGDSATERITQTIGGALPEAARRTLQHQVPYVVDSVAGALLTQRPELARAAFDWLADVVVRRGGDGEQTTRALAAALAEEFADLPETRALLRSLG